MKGRLLTDQSEVVDLAESLLEDVPEAVAIDTETTGFDLHRGDTILGLSVAWRDRRGDIQSFYVPVAHANSANLDPAPLIRALDRTGATHVFHNAPFDWRSMAQVGYTIRQGYNGSHRDTNVGAWLENENMRTALKYQGAFYFGEDEAAEQTALKAVMAGLPAKHFFDLVRPGVRKGKVSVAREWSKARAAASKKTWATLTAEDIAEYAAQDTDITLRLDERQRQVGISFNYSPVAMAAYEREMRVHETVWRMVNVGVRVDVERSARLRDEYAVKMAAIEAEFPGVNLNSPKQLGKLLFSDWMLPIVERTKGGDPSTAAEVLEQLAGAHPGLDRILEYRHYAKMSGTYLTPFIEKVDHSNRLHSSINTTGTVTGRFSSSKPNMQNIPRESTDGVLKTLFLPSDGHELWEFDLQSAELFVGASIAQDDDMLAALLTPGRDFHTETAIGLFGTADGNRRTLAKNLNYGIPYGIGPAKFASYLVKGTGKPVTKREISVANAIIQRHKLLWPKTHLAIDRLTRFAEQERYVPLHVPGRYRHFDSPDGRHVPGYTAFNAVVQGGVAEVMKDVMVAVEPLLGNLGATMVLQVHDSLWIEVPPGAAPLVEKTLQEVTAGINPFVAPLTWDGKRLDKGA